MFRLFRRIVNDKVDIIDRAFSSLGIESFADLAGVWGVEGAYTFHALDTHRVRDAVLVDTHLTPTVVARAKSYPQLRLINGNFGNQANCRRSRQSRCRLAVRRVAAPSVARLGHNPGDVRKKNVRSLLIYNQQWTGSENTVRLLDLGEMEYFRNVPHSRHHKNYINLFEKLDQKHPDHDRPWRDVHHIWQWGIH